MPYRYPQGTGILHVRRLLEQLASELQASWSSILGVLKEFPFQWPSEQSSANTFWELFASHTLPSSE